MKVNYNNNIKYKYKLNSNWKGPKEANIEGVSLMSDWRVFDEYQHSLKLRLKTPLNPDGIVDMEEINSITGQILQSTIVNTKKHIPYYTLETLETMKRDQLVEIALIYNIDPIKKIAPFLIKLILEAQNKRKQVEAELKKNQQATVNS